MMAVLKGYQPIVERLLAAGAPLNHDGWTPLMYAAFQGQTDIARLLIDRGADINQRAPNLATALMFAARNGHIDIVKLLLDRGADANVVNDQNRTAHSWALENSNTDIAELLERRVPSVLKVAPAPAAPQKSGGTLRVLIE